MSHSRKIAGLDARGKEVKGKGDNLCKYEYYVVYDDIVYQFDAITTLEDYDKYKADMEVFDDSVSL